MKEQTKQVMESISTRLFETDFEDNSLQETSELQAKAEVENRILNLIGKKFAQKQHEFKNISIEQLSKKSLFIYGLTGVGKTALVCEIVKHLVRSNVSVKFVNTTEFLHTLQRMFREDENPYSFAQNVAEYKHTLIIDDLGIDKTTEYVLQIMHYIFNYRNVNCLQTIVTSNFTINELSERLHERISSRIGEMCELLHMAGKNRRISSQ